MATIIGADTFDVRFPTSAMLDGSDAMNPDLRAHRVRVHSRPVSHRWPISRRLGAPRLIAVTDGDVHDKGFLP